MLFQSFSSRFLHSRLKLYKFVKSLIDLYFKNIHFNMANNSLNGIQFCILTMNQFRGGKRAHPPSPSPSLFIVQCNSENFLRNSNLHTRFAVFKGKSAFNCKQYCICPFKLEQYQDRYTQHNIIDFVTLLSIILFKKKVNPQNKKVLIKTHFPKHKFQLEFRKNFIKFNCILCLKNNAFRNID